MLVGVQHLHGEKYGLEQKLLSLTREDGTYVCEINSANILTLFPFISRRFSIALVTDDCELLKQRILRREPTIGNAQLTDRLETAVEEVRLIRSNACLFHLKIHVDTCPESAVAALAIEAVQKGART